MRNRLAFVLQVIMKICGVLVLAVNAAETHPGSPLEPTFFADQVRPILAERCFGCHGPEKQESNYRLDVRDVAMRGGDIGTPIHIGSAEQSPLIEYVSRADESLAMPPEGEGEPLSDVQIDTLRRWIEAGAPWPDELAGTAGKLTTDHWSFQPIANLTPPTTDSNWPRNAIDQFVFAKLVGRGLRPSEPADRTTLVRRLHLDMHGLPPTPKQIASFVQNDDEDAYEQLVSQVLTSPRYGERWARHWLDVVRFGESTGYEVNRDRENAWYYRDYVIDALNRDKSYRDFIIDQLAGDVAGDEVGTGFLVGGPYDMVKSPDRTLTLMQRQDELADYVNTTSTAFLGLTVGCARCHNHKFDPILQRDFYAMQAVFAGVEHGERKLRGPKVDEHRKKIAELQTELDSLTNQLAAYREQANAIQPVATTSSPQVRASVNAQLNTENFEEIAAKFVRFTVHQTTSGQPCIDELEIWSSDERNVALSGTPTASGTLPGYAIHKLEHINDGKYGNEHSWISNSNGSGWIQIELNVATPINRIRWGRDRNGQFRDRLATRYVVETSLDGSTWSEVASHADRRPFGDQAEHDDAYVSRLAPEDQETVKKVIKQTKELQARIQHRNLLIPKAYVGTFKQPETIYRLYRGDPLAPREAVRPDALTVVSTLNLSNDAPESQRRLKMAEWIASPHNPLTARVIVNRVWHYHFGTGIVSTPSDFGKNGTPPSHPELLDWLAWNFMENGWSLKWLHREILVSATYRQSSSPRAEALAIDADARWLWRFPPRRLEAEAIRDCVLHVSGALAHWGGGPGFLLLEIDHENVHHYFPKQDLGPAEFRRMIYMMKIRQEQDAVFGVFDCPDGGQVIPNRSRSTTPLQALNLLNSKFMLTQAATLARRLSHEAGDDDTLKVKRLYELAYGRSATDKELAVARGVIQKFGLTAVCRAVLNSNEFLFLP